MTDSLRDGSSRQWSALLVLHHYTGRTIKKGFSWGNQHCVCDSKNKNLSNVSLYGNAFFAEQSLRQHNQNSDK